MRKFFSIIFIIILIAGAAGGYFLWRANQTLVEENAQQASDLISVRRQLAEAIATPAPTPTSTPAATPAATPVSAIVLKEFSVQFAPTAGTAGVTATYTAASKSFAFTSASLAAKGGSCAAPGALGVVTRQLKTAAAPAGATKVATVKTYDFYYKGAAACAEAPELQNEQQAALQSALATLGPM